MMKTLVVVLSLSLTILSFGDSSIGWELVCEYRLLDVLAQHIQSQFSSGELEAIVANIAFNIRSVEDHPVTEVELRRSRLCATKGYSSRKNDFNRTSLCATEVSSRTVRRAKFVKKGFARRTNVIRRIVCATYNNFVSKNIWGRPHCPSHKYLRDVSGKFVCATADCASGQVTCNGAGAIPPATLAEFNIPAGGGQDFYDVSLVDGFNLPMSVTPQGGTGDCKTATCPANVNAVCSSELQKIGSDGSVVACLSACVKFNQPQYCCTPPQNTPETCPPTNYSQIFSQACPNAYSYAYDDNKGTFTCNGGPNYAITFCP
ncbi:unnamed protein product [Prunus armeniaca]